jgi:hypothetical protein
MNCNIDKKTGIRYGVVNANNTPHWVWDCIQYQCPDDCPYIGLDWDSLDFDDPDVIVGLAAIGLDPDGPNPCEGCGRQCQVIDQPNIKAQYLSGSHNFMVFWSKYICPCRLCSPCYPNAGDCDSPDSEYGFDTYCFPSEDQGDV